MSPNAGGIAGAEPWIIRLSEESHTEGFVQIVDTASGNRVVTVIEILSPTNKRAGDAQEDYRRKQRELRQGGVSLVEIDLLRSGRRVLQIPEFEIPPERRTAYAACAHRGDEPDRFDDFGFPLRERLPGICIPLRAADPDAVLDLQALVDQAYADGAYDDLDYSKPPIPPLSPKDAAWAKQRVKRAGRDKRQ